MTFLNKERYAGKRRKNTDVEPEAAEPVADEVTADEVVADEAPADTVTLVRWGPTYQLAPKPPVDEGAPVVPDEAVAEEEAEEEVAV